MYCVYTCKVNDHIPTVPRYTVDNYPRDPGPPGDIKVNEKEVEEKGRERG